MITITLISIKLRQNDVVFSWQETVITNVVNNYITIIIGIAAATGLRLRFAGFGCDRREVAALLAAGDDEGRAARGARGVRREPRVHARHVEPVPALRQHTDLVAAGKFRQADRALRPLAPITFAGVRELRQRIHHSFLQSLVRRRRRRSTAADVSWCPTEPGAASDGDEAHHANEGAEERCQDDHKVGLDGGGGDLRRWRRLGLEESEPACHVEAEEKEREGRV